MNYDFLINKIHNVIFVGKGENKGKKLVFCNNLDYNELIFHISGKSTVLFNGKQVETPPDTIRFLPKGENREYVVNVEDDGECIDVFFDTDVPISTEVFTIDMQYSKKIKPLFQKLFSAWVAKEEGYYLESMSLLYGIFAIMKSDNYIPGNKYELIKPAIEYINKNFIKEKISVKKLADICQISESYLKKLFIKRFGLPPSKYIIQLKINYACDLLQTGLYSISQVAEMCGYSDIYYFSHQFKQHMGTSPIKYKVK